VAKGEARHPAVRRNRRQVEEVRELYRRSGGTTPRLSLADLTARYEDALSDVRSFGEFRAAPLALDLAALVAPSERERLAALPDAVEVRGKWIEVEYDVEEVAGDGGEPVRRAVARLRLPEKMVRSCSSFTAGRRAPSKRRLLALAAFTPSRPSRPKDSRCYVPIRADRAATGRSFVSRTTTTGAAETTRTSWPASTT
jgi:hypothetical protein